MPHQETWAEGNSVVIRRASGAFEHHEFESEAEASARAAVITEALSWTGTPFKNCSDVKGPHGGIDCAMLMVRANVDTGRLPAFDPRPYPPAWHLHHDEERFLGWIRDKLGGVEVAAPRVGDNLVYQFGRCFSHGAILINSEEVVHAFYKSGMVHVSRRDETDLAWVADGKPRPVTAFEVRPWAGS
jgi:cell wall-associated NlpC family hydrolase